MKSCLLMVAFLFLYSCRSKQEGKVVPAQSQQYNNTIKKSGDSIIKSADQNTRSAVEKGCYLGAINNHHIFYDYYYQYMSLDVNQYKHDDKIIFYSFKENKRFPLLTFDFNGYQKVDVYLIYMQKHPFIYITTSHTYGHFCGYFYAVDIEKNTAKNVDLVYDEDSKKIRFLKGLEFDKQNGLSLDKHNNITSGDYYKDKDGNDYIYQCQYKLIRINKNTYKLRLVKSRIDPSITGK